MKKGQAIIEVVNGVEGPSLYIGDEGSGHRLAGPKPWGGGKTVHKFIVDIAELQKEAARFEKQKQKHNYAVKHNQDGTFSVVLPDDEELRIVPPQRKPLTDEEIAVERALDNLLYWTERAVNKGNANLDIEEAMQQYNDALAAAHNIKE